MPIGGALRLILCPPTQGMPVGPGFPCAGGLSCEGSVGKCEYMCVHVGTHIWRVHRHAHTHLCLVYMEMSAFAHMSARAVCVFVCLCRHVYVVRKCRRDGVNRGHVSFSAFLWLRGDLPLPHFSWFGWPEGDCRATVKCENKENVKKGGWVLCLWKPCI